MSVDFTFFDGSACYGDENNCSQNSRYCSQIASETVKDQQLVVTITFEEPVRADLGSQLETNGKDYYELGTRTEGQQFMVQ